MSELTPDTDNKRLRERRLITRLSRPLLNVPTDKCIELAAKYEPYDLFCIRSRIMPFAARLLNIPSLDIRPLSVRSNDEMVVTLDVYNGDELIDLTADQAATLQRFIDDIRDTYCCLLDLNKVFKRANGGDIDPVWLRTMLPLFDFMKIWPTYIRDDLLLINLSTTPDYIEIYTDLIVEISQAVEDGYTKALIMCDADFAALWHLTSTDNPGIWYPTWSTVLVDDLYNYLSRVMAGDTVITFPFVLAYNFFAKLISLNVKFAVDLEANLVILQCETHQMLMQLTYIAGQPHTADMIYVKVKDTTTDKLRQGVMQTDGLLLLPLIDATYSYLQCTI